jgi:hypothetical protein
MKKTKTIKTGIFIVAVLWGSLTLAGLGTMGKKSNSF